MSKTKPLLSTVALAFGLALAGPLAGPLAGSGAAAAAAATADNSGADFCVANVTPVKMGPSDASTTVGYVHRAEAWHHYYSDGNWSSGYVSRTSPTVRGFIARGAIDHSRTPIQQPDGGATCPA
jgi:hypothetical protein